MRKKILASMLALCMVLALLPATALAAFTDTEGHWSAASVERWAQAGVLTGSGDGNFLPNKEMTRAEFAQMLCNLMGYTEKAPNTFNDVPNDAWYADAILKLNAAGVLGGVGNNMAAPNAPINREQAAVLLCRAMNIQPSRSASIAFNDAGSVSSWARDSVAALTERGMINGMGGNTFAPAVNINRASVATMVDNMVAEYVTESGAKITGEVKGVVIVKARNVTVEDAKLSETLIVAPAAANASVKLTGTTQAAGVVVAAQGAKITVDKTAQVDTVAVEAPRASAEVAGKVDTITVAESASNASVTASSGASIASIETAGDNTTVTAAAGATVSSVETSAANTTVAGNGKVENVTANAGASKTEVKTNGTKVENNSSSSVNTPSGKVEAGKNETTTGTGSSGSSGGSSSGGNTGGNQGGTTNPPSGGDKDPDTPKVPTPEDGEAVEPSTPTITDPKPSDPTKEEVSKETTTAGEKTDSDCYNSETQTYTHTMPEEWTAGTAATCKDFGTETRTCTKCGAVETKQTAKVAHTPGKAEVETAGDCVTKAVMITKCTICEAVLTRTAGEADPTKHKAGVENKYGTNTDGHWLICGSCNKVLEDAKAAAHTWDEGTVSKAPTCKDAGEKTLTCTVCKATKTEAVSATGEHTAGASVAWVKTDAAKHWKICATEGCNVKVEEATHSWTDGACTVCKRECSKKDTHTNIAKGETCSECGFAGTKEETKPEPVTYTVTLDANEGTLTANTITITNGETTATELPTPTREGYKFKGWFDAKTGGNAVTLDGLKSITANKTIYAQWEQEAPTTHTCDFTKIEAVIAENKLSCSKTCSVTETSHSEPNGKKTYNHTAGSTCEGCGKKWIAGESEGTLVEDTSTATGPTAPGGSESGNTEG